MIRIVIRSHSPKGSRQDHRTVDVVFRQPRRAYHNGDFAHLESVVASNFATMTRDEPLDAEYTDAVSRELAAAFDGRRGTSIGIRQIRDGSSICRTCATLLGARRRASRAH